LSEHAAYGRIEAARAARRFPVILALLATGDITLTAVGLLATESRGVALALVVRFQSGRPGARSARLTSWLHRSLASHGYLDRISGVCTCAMSG
jgi:hypothetical protein